MLTRLGVPKLWGEEPERCWRHIRDPVSWVANRLAKSAGYGLERMPPTGGAVAAANHFTALDPAILGMYSKRPLYYMAKIELLSVPIVGEALRWTGAFAVRRGEGDRDALRVARWLAAEGHVIAMFAEGTRQQIGYPGPAQPGAALIAIQEGVPVVPCGMDTFGWSRKNRRPVALVWGDPISLDGLPRNGRGYKEGAKIIEQAIHGLWRQAMEAVADGLPERLRDGTRRGAIVRGRESEYVPVGRPWPREPWAAGPLGPVFRAAR